MWGMLRKTIYDTYNRKWYEVNSEIYETGANDMRKKI